MGATPLWASLSIQIRLSLYEFVFLIGMWFWDAKSWWVRCTFLCEFFVQKPDGALLVMGVISSHFKFEFNSNLVWNLIWDENYPISWLDGGWSILGMRLRRDEKHGPGKNSLHHFSFLCPFFLHNSLPYTTKERDLERKGRGRGKESLSFLDFKPPFSLDPTQKEFI